MPIPSINTQEGKLFYAGALAALGAYCFVTSRSRTARQKKFDSQQRAVLITGGASGIGLNSCVKFLAKGWKVGVYDINIAELEKKILAINPSLASVLAQNLTARVLDVTNKKSCEEAVAHFVAFSGGRLDVLFNSAGLLHHGPFVKETCERQRKIIEVNDIGVMQMIYCSLDALKKTSDMDPNGIGSVVVSMASAAAIGGIPNTATYSASKTFVFSLTESLRSEMWKTHRIRFADVNVMFVDTPMVQTQDVNNYSAAFKMEMKAISPEEVARTVVFAASDADYYRCHYYIRDARARFLVSYFSKIFAPKFGVWVLDELSLLPFQK